MGFLADTLAAWSAPSIEDEGHWRTIGDGIAYSSYAGVNVTEESAKRLSAVYACYKINTESVAQTPCLLYDRTGKDTRERSTSPLAYTLSTQPNDEQTPFEFFEQMQGWAVFRPFAYAEIEWQGATVRQVIPRHPDRMRRQRRADGTRRYEHLEDDGVTWRPLDDDAVMRVPGTPVLDYARDSFGMAQALERYASKSFAKGVRIAGFIAQDPGTSYTDIQRKLIKDRIEEEHGGTGKAGGVLWLPEGLKWNQIGMTNQQAEFISTKAFTVTDVARWFRIPPYMLGLLESGTVSYASVSTQGVEFVVYHLMPWLTRWEQAIGRDLIVDKRSQFAEFLTANLLRGTTKERYEVYAIALAWGVMNVNEVRRLENLNPRPGGEDFALPPNTAGPAARHIEAGSPADRLLQSLTADTAERTARRETAALAKLAERAGDDGKAWESGVRDLYADHAGYVARALHLPDAEARAYADRRRSAVLDDGVVAADPHQLVKLALSEVTIT